MYCGSWCVIAVVAAAGLLVLGSEAQYIEGPADDSLGDWRDLNTLRELDIKRAFHAMRGKKASPFHAMRGKKLKGANGDINTIIAELRRQIMAGKRGE